MTFFTSLHQVTPNQDDEPQNLKLVFKLGESRQLMMRKSDITKYNHGR